MHEEYCAPRCLSFMGGYFGIIHQKTSMKDKSPPIKDKGRPKCGAIVDKKTKVKYLKPLSFLRVIKYK